ncbi:hypothetical protein CCY01nite_52070 [Chitinophaga cymbidii]|uniref:Uncharacterized protein n=1 Tax=Chitinophaga cymbidii TaxID=1096750 RepID=A0A512RTD3_9BACT|nr:hypothetical protein CCY01nite_52070 [Chitinophaga cymbidii]
MKKPIPSLPAAMDNFAYYVQKGLQEEQKNVPRDRNMPDQPDHTGHHPCIVTLTINHWLSAR